MGERGRAARRNGTWAGWEQGGRGGTLHPIPLGTVGTAANPIASPRLAQLTRGMCSTHGISQVVKKTEYARDASMCM